MKTFRSIDTIFLERAAEEVMLHLDKNGFSGNELAEHLHLSREQTHRKLKKNTNLSTGKFIRYLRLLTAYHYINQGSLSMAEISYKVGFDSPTYFNKCFKEEWSISPGEARKQTKTAQLTNTPIHSFYQLHEIQQVLKTHGICLKFLKKDNTSDQQKNVWFIAGIPLLFMILITALLFSTKEKEQSMFNLDNHSRIAVIPFTNQTGDSLMDQVGNIASSWISSQLDELEGIKTVPYFTIKEYQPYIGILPNDPENRPTLSEVVGARYFITGSYFLKGQQLYLDTRLIDAYTQESVYHLPVMEGPKDSVMQIIENLRLKIAGLITNLEEVKLGKLTPPNYEAYKYYLSGLNEMKAGKYPSHALQYFEKAIELEPNFVMPQMFSAWFYRGEKLDSVVRLIGNIPDITAYERNVYLEFYYSRERHYHAALEVTLACLEDYPQDYYFNFEAAHLAKSQFMPQLSLDILSQLQDPLNSEVGLLWHYYKVWNYTESLVMLGKFQEALDYLQSIPTEFHNPSVPGLFLHVSAKLGKPRAEAEAIIERFAGEDKKLLAENYTAAAYEYAIVNENETSVYFARKAIPLMEKVPGKWAGYYDLADALFLSNDLKRAKDYLEKRLKEDSGFSRDEEPLDAEYHTREEFLIYLANVEAAMGNATETDQIFASLGDREQIYWRRHEYEYRIDYLKSRAYALLGKKKEATVLLKQALEHGQLHHHWDFENDIFLKPLFDYPPFQALVQPSEYTNITAVP